MSEFIKGQAEMRSNFFEIREQIAKSENKRSKLLSAESYVWTTLCICKNLEKDMPKPIKREQVRTAERVLKAAIINIKDVREEIGK